ncbi:hypothetical protein OUO02_005097, partial [Pseudomonas aeruginosa]
RHQVLGAAGAGGHPLDVIEVDGLHQLLAGPAGRIRGTDCSAPPHKSPSACRTKGCFHVKSDPDLTCSRTELA